MFSKLKDKMMKASYIKVYGDRAEMIFKEDVVEILVGNKKFVHNRESGKKISETLFTTENIVVTKYDENEVKISEEVFVDDEKVSEIDIKSGKNTVMESSSSKIKKSVSSYEKDGEEITETTLKYNDEYKKEEIEVITLDMKDYLLKSIVVKKEGEDVPYIDVQKKLSENGNLLYYKENDITVELEYYTENKIKSFVLLTEVPVYEELPQPQKGKGKAPVGGKPIEPKQIGTEIKREIVKFNESGKITNVERNDEKMTREFYEDGNLYRQYLIIDTGSSKELIGKIIMKDGSVKIINNSTMDAVEIVRKNDEMTSLDNNYKEFKLESYDFYEENDTISVSKEIYRIDRLFQKVGRRYEILENGVPYCIMEEYKKGKVAVTEKTNLISGTQLIEEGNRKYVKGLDGMKKEVCDEEYEIYKMADELNKVDVVPKE